MLTGGVFDRIYRINRIYADGPILYCLEGFFDRINRIYTLFWEEKILLIL